jgi:hypothetical protein
MVEQLAKMLDLASSDVQLGHAIAMGFGATPDLEWIPKIARDGWVIVSGDRGKHSRLADRLPIICAHYRVTHILLSPAINKRTGMFKLQAIMSVWSDILETCSAPPGTGYSLRIGPSGRAALVHKSDPPAAPPPKTQRTFL